MQLSALWCKPLITVHVLSWIPAWYIRRNRCECITLSNADFASRSTKCPFCFSSVNILYASSTGRAAFIGDDPFVNPLCVGFCILWINGCILSLITASTILLNYRQNCYSSIVDGIVFASDVKCCTLSYFASISSSETMDRWGWHYGSKRLGIVYWTQHVRANQIEFATHSRWTSKNDILQM